MYSNRWSPGARQGDVVGEIPFPLPSRRAQFVATGGITGLHLDAPNMVMVPATSRYVAIVSHDCEFNEGKRDHYLVARITNLRRDLNVEQLDQIRRGNDVDACVEADERFPIDSFYLDPIDGVFEHPQVVDFCTITPFAIASLETTRELKKAELNHDTRVLFRRKLGYFFGRDADDVPDEEKADAPAFDAGDAEDPV